jgi:hypothetical protein
MFFSFNRDIERDYSGIKYNFNMTDETYFESYYNHRWEGNTLTITLEDGTAVSTTFTMYASKSVSFSKVCRNLARLSEGECAYFAHWVFSGDNSLNFPLFYDEQSKGTWRPYHKEGVKYVEEQNNSQITHLAVEKFLKRASQEEIEKERKRATASELTLVKLAKMTDEVV